MFSAPAALKVDKLESLFQVMENITLKHNATIPQIALNWLLTTDWHILPIPGVKNVRQAMDIIGALHFSLTNEEYKWIYTKRMQNIPFLTDIIRKICV